MRLDYMKALQAPFEDKDWIKKVAIGTVLTILSFLLIPVFFLTGYFISAIKHSANGGEDLPEFEWGPNGMAGLIALLAIFALNLVPAGLMGFGAFSLIAAVMSAGAINPDAIGAALVGAGALTIGLVGIGILIMIVISFFVPALLMRYSMTGEFGSLFGFGQAISDIMASPLDYLCIFLMPNVLAFAFSMLVSVTFGIAGLLMPAFSFVVALVSARLMGDYYRLCLN